MGFGRTIAFYAFWNLDNSMAYDNLVAEPYVVLDGLQDDATRLEPGELAE